MRRTRPASASSAQVDTVQTRPVARRTQKMKKKKKKTMTTKMKTKRVITKLGKEGRDMLGIVTGTWRATVCEIVMEIVSVSAK